MLCMVEKHILQVRTTASDQAPYIVLPVKPKTQWYKKQLFEKKINPPQTTTRCPSTPFINSQLQWKIHIQKPPPQPPPKFFRKFDCLQLFVQFSLGRQANSSTAKNPGSLNLRQQHPKSVSSFDGFPGTFWAPGGGGTSGHLKKWGWF